MKLHNKCQLFPRIMRVSYFSVVLARGPFLTSGGCQYVPPRLCPALLDLKPVPAAQWGPTLSIFHALQMNTLKYWYCRSASIFRIAIPSAAYHITWLYDQSKLENQIMRVAGDAHLPQRNQVTES